MSSFSVPNVIPKYSATKKLSQFFGWSVRTLAQYISRFLVSFIFASSFHSHHGNIKNGPWHALLLNWIEWDSSTLSSMLLDIMERVPWEVTKHVSEQCVSKRPIKCMQKYIYLQSIQKIESKGKNIVSGFIDTPLYLAFRIIHVLVSLQTLVQMLTVVYLLTFLCNSHRACHR